MYLDAKRAECLPLFRKQLQAPNERHLFHFLELPSLLGPGLGDDIGLEHAPSRNVAVMFADFG